MAVEQVDHGGTLYLNFMMDVITDDSSRMMCIYQMALQSMHLNQFHGENITIAISVLYTSVMCLITCNSLPHDIINLLFDIFKSFSKEEFTFMFTSFQALAI